MAVPPTPPSSSSSSIPRSSSSSISGSGVGSAFEAMTKEVFKKEREERLKALIESGVDINKWIFRKWEGEKPVFDTMIIRKGKAKNNFMWLIPSHLDALKQHRTLTGRSDRQKKAFGDGNKRLQFLFLDQALASSPEIRKRVRFYPSQESFNYACDEGFFSLAREIAKQIVKFHSKEAMYGVLDEYVAEVIKKNRPTHFLGKGEVWAGAPLVDSQFFIHFAPYTNPTSSQAMIEIFKKNLPLLSSRHDAFEVLHSYVNRTQNWELGSYVMVSLTQPDRLPPTKDSAASEVLLKARIAERNLFQDKVDRNYHSLTVSEVMAKLPGYGQFVNEFLFVEEIVLPTPPPPPPSPLSFTPKATLEAVYS